MTISATNMIKEKLKNYEFDRYDKELYLARIRGFIADLRDKQIR